VPPSVFFTEKKDGVCLFCQGPDKCKKQPYKPEKGTEFRQDRDEWADFTVESFTECEWELGKIEMNGLTSLWSLLQSVSGNAQAVLMPTQIVSIGKAASVFGIVVGEMQVTRRDYEGDV
jgi:hypothetical protein